MEGRRLSKQLFLAGVLAAGCPLGVASTLAKEEDSWGTKRPPHPIGLPIMVGRYEARPRAASFSGGVEGEALHEPFFSGATHGETASSARKERVFGGLRPQTPTKEDFDVALDS